MQILSSPNAANEPQEQKEPKPWSYTGQTSKHPVYCQRYDQDPATPPLVSQISPHVATDHHT